MSDTWRRILRNLGWAALLAALILAIALFSGGGSDFIYIRF
jgi:hypothetical protein